MIGRGTVWYGMQGKQHLEAVGSEFGRAGNFGCPGITSLKKLYHMSKIHVLLLDS